MTERLLRLPEVLEKVGLSRSTWLRGVKEGRFPEAVRLSAGTRGWLASQIDELLAQARQREQGKK